MMKYNYIFQKPINFNMFKLKNSNMFLDLIHSIASIIDTWYVCITIESDSFELAYQSFACLFYHQQLLSSDFNDVSV